MKKLLTILAIASAATFAYAQGSVILNNANALYFVSTNGAAIPGGGTIGVTAKTVGGFDYAVLLAPYGSGAPSGSPLDGAWSVAGVLTGLNYPIAAGGIAGQGGALGSAGTGAWGAPTGLQYTDATENYFLIVGWSSNLGTTWAQAKANLPGLAWSGNAFFGASAVGFGFSGGGPGALPAPSLFGVSPGMPGALTSGFQLMYVPIPEPSTLALAGLGGLSLLLFRRRK